MRRVALALFGTIAGLVFLLDFKTHSTGVGTVPAAVGAADPTTGAAGGTTTPATGSTASSAAGSASSTGTKTVTGDSVDTRWGPVKVQITVTNGKVTKANAVVYPSG